MNLFTTESLGIKSNIRFEESPNSEKNPFKPIGIGKPLVIRFHTVYLGDLKKGIFGSNQDIMVCSAIKDDSTFEAAPRAIHQLFRKKDNRETLSPSAINRGTPLIYYSKAFDKETLNITVEIKADKFPEKVFNNVSNALSLAGGIPIFGALSTYLLAGGQIIKSASSILNTLTEGAPLLTNNFNILDGVAGLKNTKAGFVLGANNGDQTFFKSYEITDLNDDNQLVMSKNGKQYLGPKPYIIMSIDGSEKASFKSFSPTIASAALLKKFYGITENSPINEMSEILNVYNDFTYVQKFNKTKKELEDATGERKSELEELMKAYEKNIQNADLYKLN